MNHGMLHLHTHKTQIIFKNSRKLSSQIFFQPEKKTEKPKQNSRLLYMQIHKHKHTKHKDDFFN